MPYYFDCSRLNADQLARPVGTWPRLMPLCRELFGAPRDDGNRAVRDRLLDGQFTLGDVCTPSETLIADGFTQRIRSVARIAQAVMADPADVAARTSPLKDRLLADALHSGNPTPRALREAMDRGAMITLPIVLVSEAMNEQGLVADLSLWLLEFEEADCKADAWTFVASPSCCLIHLDMQMTEAMARAMTVARNHLPPSDRQPFAIVWDITSRLAPGKPAPAFSHVVGSSAGAALALGALRLLRQRIANEALRTDLEDIDESRAAVTAALVDDTGRLGRVEGVALGKIEALTRQDRPYVCIRDFFIASQQLPLPRQYQAEPHASETVDELIASVARHTGAARRYGKFPDAPARRHGRQFGTDDLYADFTGRDWLTAQVAGALDELNRGPRRGGIVVLEAPMGWGKTAAALHWVDQVVLAGSASAGLWPSLRCRWMAGSSPGLKAARCSMR